MTVRKVLDLGDIFASKRHLHVFSEDALDDVRYGLAGTSRALLNCFHRHAQCFPFGPMLYGVQANEPPSSSQQHTTHKWRRSRRHTYDCVTFRLVSIFTSWKNTTNRRFPKQRKHHDTPAKKYNKITSLTVGERGIGR